MRFRVQSSKFMIRRQRLMFKGLGLGISVSKLEMHLEEQPVRPMILQFGANSAADAFQQHLGEW